MIRQRCIRMKFLTLTGARVIGYGLMFPAGGLALAAFSLAVGLGFIG
jgi:hypothetical protein